MDMGYGSTSTTGYSNTMDGVLLQNTGTGPIDYEFIGIDTWGDGWHGNYMRFQVAPLGTWSTSTQQDIHQLPVTPEVVWVQPFVVLVALHKPIQQFSSERLKIWRHLC